MQELFSVYELAQFYLSRIIFVYELRHLKCFFYMYIYIYYSFLVKNNIYSMHSMKVLLNIIPNKCHLDDILWSIVKLNLSLIHI